MKLVKVKRDLIFYISFTDGFALLLFNDMNTGRRTKSDPEPKNLDFHATIVDKSVCVCDRYMNADEFCRFNTSAGLRTA